MELLREKVERRDKEIVSLHEIKREWEREKEREKERERERKRERG